jgi:hypothetical protein
VSGPRIAAIAFGIFANTPIQHPVSPMPKRAARKNIRPTSEVQIKTFAVKESIDKRTLPEYCLYAPPRPLGCGRPLQALTKIFRLYIQNRMTHSTARIATCWKSSPELGQSFTMGRVKTPTIGSR